jgi:hypothetical protein
MLVYQRVYIEHLSWRLCCSEQSASDHAHQWSASFSSRIGRSVLTLFGSCKQWGLEKFRQEKGSLFPTGVFLIRENKYTHKNKKQECAKHHIIFK